MKGKYSKESSIQLLIDKQKLLTDGGLARYPQRSDFEDEEVCAIKAFLGPWPRALEAAGLKPPRDDNRREKNKEKRIRAKRRRTEALIERKKNKSENDNPD